MNLFELFVKIGVDDSEFNKGVGRAKKGFGDFSAWTIAKGQLIADAIKVSGKAFLDLGKQAINSFSEYEQLAGGAQKIFDQMDYSKIANDANNAYKELGLSANQYLAVINDVGATFAATMGDEAGYEAAKTGLKAISDYASGTGKNVDELSQKFTLITRSTSSYQSIADQFSGILPATSKGFLEQAQAAGILSDSYTQLTQVPIDEYQAAVSKMLQQGVKDLGLANNTINEAFSTLSGSLSMAKGAWNNLVTGLADDSADLERLIEDFVESVGVAAGNILPKVQNALTGAAKLIETLIPVIMEEIPVLIGETLPQILQAGVGVIETILRGISSQPDEIVATIFKVIDILIDAIIDLLPEIVATGILLIGKLAVGLVKAIPDLVAKIPEIIKSVVNSFKSRSGEFSGIGRDIVNGIWSGIKSMISTFTANVKNFFSGIVNSVKQTLGIRSPSRVFAEIGGFMAEGVSQGWENQFEDVRKDINKSLSFDDASIRIGASVQKIGNGIADSTYGGFSIGNININIEGAKYSDERSLAAAIAQEIQNMADREAAVYA